MKIYQQLCSFMAVLFVFPNTGSSYSCNIPVILQGTWFSRENGRNTFTELDATSMSRRGRCLAMKEEFHVNYTLIFKQDLCYTCVKFLVRTVNVLEKIETPCVDAPEDHVSIDTICHSSNSSQQLVTLFSENYVPVNCRSSLHGVWNFAYQNKFKFTGECKHPDSYIRSCEQPDSQFLKTNQRFNITYKKCTGMTGSFDGVVEYSCLGDWFLGKNHYFAVANTKESRRDEKYRCFLKNLDSDLYLGVSTTADCSTLNTVENSPERLHIKPVQPEIIEPGCRLPQNFSGNWINTADTDADIFINETHIIETWNYDNGRSSKTTYVCKEQHDSLVMMARLTIGSCQKEYVCFDFVLQHHNIVRYRKGTPMITDNFHTVCSKMRFQNQVKPKYELYLRKNPVPIRCPIGGKFNFTQKGDILFQTRILGGVTFSPRPNTYCKENISDFSICDTDQKNIEIDENYCLSVDHKERPVDTFSNPDYRMTCVAYWKENNKSYLITYDDLDLFSQYRCWVYERTDLNRILLSQAVGSFCDPKQDVYSSNYTEGAAVHLEMREYKRENDQCPMHFDDGSNL